MCRGLSDIHNKQYVHSDVKALNLFIENQEDLEQGVIKIADFGGIQLNGRKLKLASCNAPEWMTYIKDGVLQMDLINVTYSYDAYCGGLTILNFIMTFQKENKYSHGTLKNSWKMNQADMEAFIQSIENKVNNNFVDIIDKEIIEQLADVALQLTTRDPNDRICC